MAGSFGVGWGVGVGEGRTRRRKHFEVGLPVSTLAIALSVLLNPSPYFHVCCYLARSSRFSSALTPSRLTCWQGRRSPLEVWRGEEAPRGGVWWRRVGRGGAPPSSSPPPPPPREYYPTLHCHHPVRTIPANNDRQNNSG